MNVYCYTGQTVSQVASALNLLGYDAYNLLSGMEGWTMDDEVRAKFFNPETHLNEYPYEGTAAEGTAEETTTEETAEPETMPTTGGVALPLEGVLVCFGALTAAAGLYLRRRQAA